MPRYPAIWTKGQTRQAAKPALGEAVEYVSFPLTDIHRAGPADYPVVAAGAAASARGVIVAGTS